MAKTESVEGYSKTTNAIAAAVPCDSGTVRHYCDWGLIEHQRLANGTRFLKPSAVEGIRKIRAERLARRGGKRQAAQQPERSIALPVRLDKYDALANLIVDVLVREIEQEVEARPPATLAKRAGGGVDIEREEERERGYSRTAARAAARS
ncbi:MAG: hypothetical protein M0038_15445 [Pseudomonadota bacterium]|nr:hypothetical protein [Pseudomonadota bacterium]